MTQNGDATGLLRETAQRLIKRGAGAPPPTPEETRARDRQGARARQRGSAGEGHHDVPGRRIGLRDHRSHEADGGRGQDGRPPLGDGAAGERGDRAEAGAVPDDRLRQRPPHRARDQEVDRRRARPARRLAAGALLRQAGVDGPRDDQGRRDRGDGAPGDAARLPARRARDRRPRQPRDARHLRARVQGESRRRRICAGASSTRSTSARRTSRASASSA